MLSKQELHDFINTHRLMVISSIGPNGQSQSAVVGFGQTKDLEIIFGTEISSRKARNIIQDPRVSIVIGWDEGKTVQYEGEVRLLTGDDIAQYTEIYFQKNKRARKFLNDSRQRYFLVKPTWIRYTDVSTDPWLITEYKF